MPKFVTVGFGDQEGYDRTDTAVRDDAHKADARLREAGATMGRAGSPVQVRNHGGEKVVVTPGSFSSADLPVPGFAIIEAENLEEAIALASQNPCAVAYGVVEVWPLKHV